jgi:hypothetical protein
MFDKRRLRGSFSYGIPNEFGEIVGHIVVRWAHLEEEMIPEWRHCWVTLILRQRAKFFTPSVASRLD